MIFASKIRFGVTKMMLIDMEIDLLHSCVALLHLFIVHAPVVSFLKIKICIIEFT